MGRLYIYIYQYLKMKTGTQRWDWSTNRSKYCFTIAFYWKYCRNYKWPFCCWISDHRLRTGRCSDSTIVTNQITDTRYWRKKYDKQSTVPTGLCRAIKQWIWNVFICHRIQTLGHFMIWSFLRECTPRKLVPSFWFYKNINIIVIEVFVP